MAVEKKWKPMLLSNNDFDLNDLDYSNMYISIKRDGVRAEIINGELKGRSLKLFKNYKLYEYFKDILSSSNKDMALEAEIYCDGIPCREMAGICNSKNKDIPEGTKLYIFGMVDLEKTFEQRYQTLQGLKNHMKVKLVKQYRCESPEEALTTYQMMLDDGFEGAVLMDGSKKYKPGRVTIKQHVGFKLKPHKEDDLEIIGVTERLINTNESQINELGQSYKRNTVDDKEGTGIAACFVCKLPSGDTVNVTITGDEESRRIIWNTKSQYNGCYAVVKSMDYGAKNKLRHPRLLKIKEAIEK